MPRNARILVCEDSATVQLHLRLLLEPLYDLVVTGTGEEAVAAATELPPDVILCDLMLPGIPGTEVCRRVRAAPALRDVPFVLVTQLTGEESRALGLESGADDYLEKPVRERELVARVASLVRLRRAMQEVEARTHALEAANAALRAAAPPDPAELDATLREAAALVTAIADSGRRLEEIAATLRALGHPLAGAGASAAAAGASGSVITNSAP